MYNVFMKKIFAPFVLWYIKFWAKMALFIHKPKTIGIAGSVGKSSCRNAIYAVLRDQATTRMVGGNSETGVPLGILGIEISDFSASSWLKILLKCPFKLFATVPFKYLIVEMGIDDPFPPKNMSYLLSIIKPDISLDLNATATHTMQFEKLLVDKPSTQSKIDFLLEKIAQEDAKIMTHAQPKIGIYNEDDPNVSQALQNYKGRTATFGRAASDLSYGKYDVTLKGTSFGFYFGDKLYEVKIKNYALPKVYQDTFGSTLLVAKYLEIDIKDAISAIERKFVLPKGRSTILKGKKGLIIIDSSYNSSANAVISSLHMLSRIAKLEKRRAIFLMGDMRELGEEAASEHSRVAKEINNLVDQFYCVGPLTKEYVMPKINLKLKPMWFQNAKKVGNYLLQHPISKGILLVKGSQNELYLEEAVKMLLANRDDSVKLCRQNQYWQNLKDKYFESVSDYRTA